MYTYVLAFMIGILISILFVNIYLEEYSTRTIIHEDIITIDGDDVLEYPYDATVFCEDGVDIERYEYIDKIILYGCLRHINNRCAGHGKLCYVKYKEEVKWPDYECCMRRDNYDD
jgi:hypothetical protein